MAIVLNEYFKSVFTTGNTFPFIITKFEGDISDHLVQLFVTPEMLARTHKKIQK